MAGGFPFTYTINVFHQWGWWSVLVIIIYFTSEDGEVYLSSLYIFQWWTKDHWFSWVLFSLNK
jgi:hypothetical protein